jgi:hypothetical protein
MSTRLRRPSPGTVLGGLALIVASSGIAWAAIPASNGTVTTCVPQRNILKVPVVVDAEAGRNCPANHTPVRLATTDPTGKVADADKLDGLDSIDVQAKAFTAAGEETIPDNGRVTVMSQTVPAGRYVMNVSLLVINDDIDNLPGRVGCRLQKDDASTTIFTESGTEMGPREIASLSLTWASNESAGDIRVSCAESSASDDLRVRGTMTLIKVGSIG